MTVNTYLNYGGNCAEALRFYEKHLGGKILMMMTYGDNPGANAANPGMEHAVLHARIEIDGTAIMASDSPPDRFAPMRNVFLSLGVDSNQEAERLYALLSEGGEIFMPIGPTFFAHRFGMLRDKFGTSWMIIHERPMPAAA